MSKEQCNFLFIQCGYEVNVIVFKEYIIFLDMKSYTSLAHIKKKSYLCRQMRLSD